MRETDRAAMTARLEALERMIEAIWASAPARGELHDAADKDAAGRLSQLLLQAATEAARLRARLRLPTPMERAEAACVPLAPR
ncbi:MAG: hypothetical protein AB7O88_09095 [Reyranellaceae bacterium]